MKKFTFFHKTIPNKKEEIMAGNQAAARQKLSDRGINLADYKEPTEKEAKEHEYHSATPNPHGEDEHAIPEEVQELRRQHA